MNKLLFLVFIIPIFLTAQIPIAEFDFQGNIEDTYGNFEAEGNPIYNSDMSALACSKDYEILIDPEEDLDIVDLTTQISFRTSSSEIPFYGQYAIEGLYYKGGDTGSANRSMSLYLFGASSPFDIFYVHSNAGQFELLIIRDVINTDVLYDLHIVQTIDSVHIYNDCKLLGKGPVNSSDINYNSNALRLGMIPAPEGFFVQERAFNGEIHSLRFYDQALTADQIERSCVVSNSAVEEPAVEDWHFSVYPNPSTGVYQLKSNHVGLSYRVIDVTGQTVLSGLIETMEATLDLTNNASGAYIITIVDENDRMVGSQVLKIN